MPRSQKLHVLETDSPVDEAPTLDVDQTEPNAESQTVAVDADVAPDRYADADGVELRDYCDNYTFPTFVDTVLHALEGDATADEARLVDDLDEPADLHFGALLVFPDETLLFLGSDPTAKDAIPWFAFAIEPFEPVPAPDTARDALNLLRPPEVQDALAEDEYLAPRHGEWFLLPTTMIPAGSVIQPGVKNGPLGPSPLGNHIPREFAFTVRDGIFMQRFREEANAPASIATPAEAIEWTHRQVRKPFDVDGAPDWAAIRDWAGDILVRGSIRHRDDDHYVEQCGDDWHVAVTHDMRVYTGDEVATDVHLDYHGRQEQLR